MKSKLFAGVFGVLVGLMWEGLPDRLSFVEPTSFTACREGLSCLSGASVAVVADEDRGPCQSPAGMCFSKDDRVVKWVVVEDLRSGRK